MWSLWKERTDIKRKIYPAATKLFDTWDPSLYQRFEDPADATGTYEDIDEDLLLQKINDITEEWTSYKASTDVSHDDV